MKSISQGTVEVAHQVGEEEHGALQHADHEQVAALVVPADLLAQLGDAPLQVLAGDQGLADRRVAHGRSAAQSRLGRASALGAQHAALGDRPHAAAEVEHRGAGAAQRRHLVGVVGSPGDGTAGGAVGEPLDDEPAQGRGSSARRSSSIVPRGDPFEPSSSAATSASSTSASSRSSSAVRSTLRAAAGWTSARARGPARGGRGCGRRRTRRWSGRRASRGRAPRSRRSSARA